MKTSLRTWLLSLALLVPLPVAAADGVSDSFYQALSILYRDYYDRQHLRDKLTPERVSGCESRAAAESNGAGIRCLLDRLGDPYSRWLSSQEAQAEREHVDSHRPSYGVHLSPFDPHMIASVQPGSPAAEAGLQTGDKIVSLNGTDTRYLTGRELELRWQNLEDQDQTISVVWQRGYRTFEANLSPRQASVEPMMLQKIGDVAYVRVTDLLADNAYPRFRELMNDPAVQEASGLLLDLRGNAGGLLSNAIKISDALLAEGNIVITESSDGRSVLEADSKRLYGGPVAILVNGQTASAGELIAAALKVNDRAILVGQRTFGKGLIQRIFPLDDRSALHVTVLEFMQPEGSLIHLVGVEPDVYVKQPQEQLAAATDEL